jgi:hypothetical protein
MHLQGHPAAIGDMDMIRAAETTIRAESVIYVSGAKGDHRSNGSMGSGIVWTGAYTPRKGYTERGKGQEAAATVWADAQTGLQASEGKGSAIRATHSTVRFLLSCPQLALR